jgi:epoxyqueuosine reductase
MTAFILTPRHGRASRKPVGTDRNGSHRRKLAFRIACQQPRRRGGRGQFCSPFQSRAALAGKDARQLAREILRMDVDAYRAAFRGSATKRAKLPAMQRNAAVVLGNVGTADDVAVLTRALDDAEPLVREHAAWALARLRPPDDAVR